MFYKSEFGGVTYDLAHHLISILGILFGFETLKSLGPLELKKFISFSEGYADKEMSCSFKIDEVSIDIYVAKNSNTDKKVISFSHLHSDKDQEFDLSSPVDYSNILNSPFMTLSLEQENIINKILLSIFPNYHSSDEITSITLDIEKYCEKIHNINDNNASIELLSILNEEFKHRHSFYWATYYRLFIYHLILILAPSILFYYITSINNHKIPDFILAITCLLLSVVSRVVTKKFLKDTIKYLDAEDHRLTIPINRMREIYYNNFNINMYPDDKQNNSFKEILINSKLSKSPHKGIGSNHMVIIMKRICYLAADTSIIMFLFLSYILF